MADLGVGLEAVPGVFPAYPLGLGREGAWLSRVSAECLPTSKQSTRKSGPWENMTDLTSKQR